MRAHAASAGRGRRRGGAAATAAALLLALAVSACSTAEETPAGTSPSRAVSTPSTPTASLVPASEITAAGGVALPVRDADWVQVADGHVWTTLGTEVAQQLDATTGAELTSVPLGGQVCTAMDQGFDALWIAVCSTPAKVLRLDPASGQVLARIAIPEGLQIMEEGSVASGEGFVWVVAVGDERTLVKIDPTTNTVVDQVPVEVGVTAARAGQGALWTTNTVTEGVERRDPSTGALVTSVPTGKGARFFAVGEGAVWVQNNVDGTVTRVDPASNSVTARYSPAAGSGSVAADASAAWISAHDQDLVYRLPLN